MKRFPLIAFAAALFIMPACTDDDTATTEPQGAELTAGTAADVTVKLTDNNAENFYSIGDTIPFSNGYELYLSKFKFYLSNFTLVHEDGRTYQFKDLILGDFSESASLQFRDSVPLGKFTELRFSLGLDPETNNLQPEDFAQEHPLSTYNQMYWTMLKYRFAIFEGKANLSGQLGNSDDALIAYHPGTDPLYKEFSAPVELNIVDESMELNLQVLFNANRMIVDPSGNNSIDFMTEPQSHSAETDIAIAIKFMENWQRATSVSTTVQTR